MNALIALLAVTSVAVLVLAIPVDLAVKVETTAVRKVQVRLNWLFGLLGIDLSGRMHKRIQKARKPRKRSKVVRRMRAAFLTIDFLEKVLKLVRRIVTGITLRQFHLRVRLGFADPGDTALLFAVVIPATWLLRACGATRNFSAEVDFEKESFFLSGDMSVRVFPIRILGAVVLFLIAPPVLRAVKAGLWSR